MRRYAQAWITLGFFLVSIAPLWLFGWYAFVDEARDHGTTPQLAAYLVPMGRDMFETWPSDFLQLLWQVVGLAYFLYVRSPASKENDGRAEARIDALPQRVGRARGEALIREIDATHGQRAVTPAFISILPMGA